MPREMKFHIFNINDNTPLCWGKEAIEFDTKGEAEQFLLSYPEIAREAYVKECILYYDGGHINGKDL